MFSGWKRHIARRSRWVAPGRRLELLTGLGALFASGLETHLQVRRPGLRGSCLICSNSSTAFLYWWAASASIALLRSVGRGYRRRRPRPVRRSATVRRGRWASGRRGRNNRGGPAGAGDVGGLDGCEVEGELAGPGVSNAGTASNGGVCTPPPLFRESVVLPGRRGAVAAIGASAECGESGGRMRCHPWTSRPSRVAASASRTSAGEAPDPRRAGPRRSRPG